MARILPPICHRLSHSMTAHKPRPNIQVHEVVCRTHSAWHRVPNRIPSVRHCAGVHAYNKDPEQNPTFNDNRENHAHYVT